MCETHRNGDLETYLKHGQHTARALFVSFIDIHNCPENKTQEIMRHAKEMQDNWAKNRRMYAEQDKQEMEREEQAEREAAEKAQREKEARSAALAIKRAAAGAEKAAFAAKVEAKRSAAKIM